MPLADVLLGALTQHVPAPQVQWLVIMFFFFLRAGGLSGNHRACIELLHSFSLSCTSEYDPSPESNPKPKGPCVNSSLQRFVRLCSTHVNVRQKTSQTPTTAPSVGIIRSGPYASGIVTQADL